MRPFTPTDTGLSRADLDYALCRSVSDARHSYGIGSGRNPDAVPAVVQG
jgi:hypothetical protein